MFSISFYCITLFLYFTGFIGCLAGHILIAVYITLSVGPGKRFLMIIIIMLNYIVRLNVKVPENFKRFIFCTR